MIWKSIRPEEGRAATGSPGAWRGGSRQRRPLVYAIALASAGWAGANDLDEPSRGQGQDWPAWRGPLGTGVSPDGDPPLEWGEGKNVRWAVELPGLGHSTPIVWRDRVFVTTSVPVGEKLAPRPSRAPGAHDNLPVTRKQSFVVLCLARSDGRILWQRTLREALPEEQGHETASLASASPSTDGRVLIAPFGSFGIFALDLDGKPLWEVDLGKIQILHGHGEGSSPAIHGQSVVVTWDHEGKSFVVALDLLTGKERWRMPRDEPTSWASPIVAMVGGRPQALVSGTHRVRGYDLETGSVIWECGGLSSNVVASPVYGDGMLYTGSSYDTRALLAIHIEGARGDLTGTRRVVWRRTRGTPYVPSPLLYRDALYFITHYQGVLNRVVARTGVDQPGPFRLDTMRNLYASPVAASGRVYVTDLDGLTLVIEDGPRPRIVARNQLEDSFSASAAIAGRELFLRGRRRLYCLGQ